MVGTIETTAAEAGLEVLLWRKVRESLTDRLRVALAEEKYTRGTLVAAKTLGL